MVLPSKKIIPTFAACLIVVGALIFALQYNPTPKKAAAKTISTVSQTQAAVQASLADQDSDHDGLKDWEEVLWGTDPHNPDTDGDGTPDGVEVQQGRNPLVKGPNDKLDTNNLPAGLASSVSTKTTSASSTQDVTATAKLAHDLFTKYMDIKQSGGQITPDVENQLAQNLVDSSSLYTQSQAPFYSIDSFTTVPDSDTAIKNYGNALGQILKKDSPGKTDNELVIVEQAANNQDKNEIAKLDPIIISYKKIVADLIGLPVPKSAVGIHTDLVNNFSQTIDSDQNLRKLFDDPLAALNALQTFQTNVQDLANTLHAYETYFKTEGIDYSPNELGYSFAHPF